MHVVIRFPRQRFLHWVAPGHGCSVGPMNRIQDRLGYIIVVVFSEQFTIDLDDQFVLVLSDGNSVFGRCQQGKERQYTEERNPFHKAMARMLVG